MKNVPEQVYNVATGGLPWWLKGVLVAGGIGIAGYIGYKLVQGVVAPGPPGGSCTTPGTPCYEAMYPYKVEFENCADRYFYYLNKFIKENSQNGTGFTTAQNQVLQKYKACMNSAAKHIAKTAKQYTPHANIFSLLTILATGVAVAVVLRYGGVGMVKIFKALKTYKVAGYGGAATTTDAMTKAAIQYNAEMGEISTQSAQALSEDVQQITAENIDDTQSFTQDLVSNEIVSATEAEEASDIATTTMVEDEDETLLILRGFE